MRILRSLLVVLAVGLAASPAAGAASRAVVNVDVTGAGVAFFDLDDGYDDASPDHFGHTCAAVRIAGRPSADLRNPTGARQNLCRLDFTAKGCRVGQAPPCDVMATVEMVKPDAPLLTPAEVAANHWLRSGYFEAPAGCVLLNGNQPTCRFKVGSCTVDGCTYEPPITLAFAFRDERAPVASFKCRLAGGGYDPASDCGAVPPALTTTPTGTVGFRARSDEYTHAEYSAIECSLDGADWTRCPAAPGPVVPGTFALTGVADGPHTLAIRARDPSGNTGPAQSTSFTQRYPPVTTITGGPAEGAAVAARKPQFTFAADRKAAFECRFDAQAWAACEDAFAPSVSLADGDHTFSVRATRTTEEGIVGEVDPPVRRFSVDNSGPDAFITDGPENDLVTTSRVASFAFVADPPEEGITFRCRLDSGAAEACDGGTVTYVSLPAGRHTFTLTAFDRAGNGLRAPQTRTWTVITDADRDGSFGGREDCDDANPAVRPGAPEIPGNGVDEDCDGVDPPNLDLDGDGFLAPPQGRDCDDRDPKRHPGAAEVLANGIDEDCDGEDPPDHDKDDDGVLAPPLGGDCDDKDPAIRPGVRDVPENGVDENCNEVDARLQPIGLRFGASWQPYEAYTLVVKFYADDVPAGTVLRFRCRGGCQETSGRMVVRRKRAKVGLRSWIGRRMAPGAVLEVRAARPGRLTELHRWRFRADDAPARTDRCVRRGKVGPC